MQLHYQLVHVASRVQTWAEECVHLHEVLKIEISIFSISCTVIHIHPPTFELCSLELHALSSFIRPWYNIIICSLDSFVHGNTLVTLCLHTNYRLCK